MRAVKSFFTSRRFSIVAISVSREVLTRSILLYKILYYFQNRCGIQFANISIHVHVHKHFQRYSIVEVRPLTEVRSPIPRYRLDGTYSNLYRDRDHTSIVLESVELPELIDLIHVLYICILL